MALSHKLNVVLIILLVGVVVLNYMPRHQIQSRWLPIRPALAPMDCTHGLTEHYAVKLRQDYSYEKHKSFLQGKVDLDTAVYTSYQSGEGPVYGAHLSSAAVDAVRADHGVAYIECVEAPAPETST